MSGLSLGTCTWNLKSVSLTVLCLLCQVASVIPCGRCMTSCSCEAGFLCQSAIHSNTPLTFLGPMKVNVLVQVYLCLIRSCSNKTSISIHSGYVYAVWRKNSSSRRSIGVAFMIKYTCPQRDAIGASQALRLGMLPLSPIHTADADETKLSSLVASASAVCTWIRN